MKKNKSESRNHKRTIAIGIAIVAGLAALWVHLAVGIVDTWPFAGS